MPRQKKPVKQLTVAPVVELLPTRADTYPSKDKKQFEYKRLSASMMKTWMQCPRKFHKNYIEGIPEPANPSFSLGNSVHEALEQANISLMDRPRKLTEEEIEGYIQLFRDNLAKTYINSAQLFNDGEEMVRSELEKITGKEKIIQAENEFDIITPEGVRIYGFIDRVIEVDKNTVKIEDYKTSINPLSYEEAKIDVQLSMYELVAAILYPQYKNRKVSLRYLRSGKELTTDRSATAQLNFRKQLLAIHKAISGYMSSLGSKKEEPKGRVNTFCNWCSYRTNCTQYIEQLTNISSTYLSAHELTDDLFIKEYLKASIVEKAIKEFKDQLKIWALERIEACPDTPIMAEDAETKVDTLSTTRRSYDPKTIAKYIKHEDYINLVNINNTKLDAYLEAIEDENVKLKIEQSAVIKFNSPQIRLKKVK